MSAVLERGRDVAGLEVRIIFVNLFARGTRGEQVEYVRDPDPKAAQTGTSATHLGIDGDAVQFTHFDLTLCPGSQGNHHEYLV